MSPTDEEQKGKKIKPWLPENWDFEADVVIVGYGGAGACAAVAANDAGAQALVIEKAPTGGGNTISSWGFMNIPRDATNATEYYRALTKGGVDEELLPAFAEVMVGLPHKLEEWGAKLKHSTTNPTYPAFPGSTNLRRTCFAYTSRQARGKGPVNLGIPLFTFLDEQTKKRGINVMYETPAKELIRDPITKEILGVKAESLAGVIYVRANRGVVLACGGLSKQQRDAGKLLAIHKQIANLSIGNSL